MRDYDEAVGDNATVQLRWVRARTASQAALIYAHEHNGFVVVVPTAFLEGAEDYTEEDVQA